MTIVFVILPLIVLVVLVAVSLHEDEDLGPPSVDAQRFDAHGRPFRSATSWRAGQWR